MPFNEISDLTQLDLSNLTLQLCQQQMGIGHSTWAYFSDKKDSIDKRTKDSLQRRELGNSTLKTKLQ